MVKIFWLTLITLLSAAPSYSQSVQVKGEASIENLKRDLGFLASDELRGRDSGTPDADRAASYIAEKFQSYGLEPFSGNLQGNPFFHLFSIISSPVSVGCKIKIAELNQNIYNYSDLITLTGTGFENTSIKPYVGTIDSLKSNGAYAKVLNAESLEEGLKRVEELMSSEGSKTFMVVLPVKKLIEVNRQRTILAGNSIPSVNSFGDTLLSAMFSQPFLLKENTIYSKVLPFIMLHKEVKIFVTDEYLIKKLFTKEQLEKYAQNMSSIGNTLSFNGKIKPDAIVRSRNANVLGCIKGTSLSDEYIFVTSHYDHIGISKRMKSNETTPGDSICNGADDNASGTSAVMETARLFGELRKSGISPKRTVVFISFTGEEKGLLGSQYLAENPIVPNAKIKTVVNLDMVGRTNSEHTVKDMYVYALLLGDTTQLSAPLVKAQKLAKIGIPKAIPEREKQLWTMGSDHYSFYKKGIPAIVLTTGEHPDYHTPADEAAKIVFDRLTRITNLTYHTVWELANR